jgi:secreted Zn-dependent insulinase-like peptidase
MKNMEDAKKGFTEVFLDKLKEQSFTIVLMVGILVYQTINKNAEIEKLEKQIGVKQEYIDKMVEDQRQRWQVREQYLMQQRDTYIEDLLKQNTK